MTPRYRPEPLWWAPASDPADPDSNGETLLPGETIPEARVRLGCYDASSSALVTGTQEMLAEQAVKSAQWRQSMGLGRDDQVERAQEALASRKEVAAAARGREYGPEPQMPCCIEVFPGETTQEAIDRTRVALFGASTAVERALTRRAETERGEQLNRWADDDRAAEAGHDDGRGRER